MNEDRPMDRTRAASNEGEHSSVMDNDSKGLARS